MIDDITKSSSAKLLATPFNTSYGDNAAYKGFNVNETLSFGGISMDNIQVAVVESAGDLVETALGPDVQGIMGIAQVAGEAAVVNEQPSYPNVPTQLKNNGLINSVSYSMYLDDQGGPSPPTRLTSEGAPSRYQRADHPLSSCLYWQRPVRRCR